MDKEEYIKKYGIEAYNDHPSKKGKTTSKYSVCKNQILKHAWEYLEPKLKEDFDIEMRHEMRKLEEFDRAFAVIALYKDNKHICDMQSPNPMLKKSINLKFGRKTYDVLDEPYYHDAYRLFTIPPKNPIIIEHPVRETYHYFINLQFDMSAKDYIINGIESIYLSKIWAVLIDELNKIKIEEAENLPQRFIDQGNYIRELEMKREAEESNEFDINVFD